MEEIEKLANKIKTKNCFSKNCDLEKKVLEDMLIKYNRNSYTETPNGHHHVYCFLDCNNNIKCDFERKRMF